MQERICDCGAMKFDALQRSGWIATCWALTEYGSWLLIPVRPPVKPQVIEQVHFGFEAYRAAEGTPREPERVAVNRCSSVTQTHANGRVAVPTASLGEESECASPKRVNPLEHLGFLYADGAYWKFRAWRDSPLEKARTAKADEKSKAYWKAHSASPRATRRKSKVIDR